MAIRRSSSAGTRRHLFVAAGGRLLAVAALPSGGPLAAAPAAAQADEGLDGNNYTSADYGWSVEFDDRVWEAEEVDERDSQGVSLSGDEIFANLIVYDDGIDEVGACLEDLDRAFNASNDWEGLAPARNLDAPETASDAQGELYTGTLTLDDGEIDLALYLECREVQDATLSITVTAIEASYEDNLPDIEALLASIETGASSGGDTDDDGPSPDGPVNRGDDDPTPEEDPTEEADDTTPDAEPTPENDAPVLDHEPADLVGQDADGTLEDDTYVSAVGYGLAWDAERYEGETPDDPGTGVLLENVDTGATVEVAAFEDPAIEDCIGAEVQRVLESPDYVSAAVSNGVRPPTSGDDAVGRIIRATEDTTQQQRKIVYVECRPLLDEGEDGDPVFLVVRAISDDEDFRASRTELEAILTSIVIGDDPAPGGTEEPEADPTRRPTEEPEDEPTPRPRRTPTAEPDDRSADLGGTDIADGVFVAQRVPFKVEWDTAYWEVTEIEARGIEGISIVTDEGALGRIVSANSPSEFDMEACITSLIEGWAELTPDLSQFEPDPAAEIVFPEGTTSVYTAGTFTFEDGSTAVMVSAGGCLELEAGGFLIIQIQIFDAVYAQNQAAFNEVLATLEFGSGDQIGALPAAGRASPDAALDMQALLRQAGRPSR